MAKIKIKANIQPYANNESLKRTLGIEIKKAFNEVFLNDLVTKLNDVFNKFDSKKTEQLTAYQEQLIDIKDRLEKCERDNALLYIIIRILGIIITFLLAYIFYLVLY